MAKTVLVVDDSKSMRQMVSFTMAEEGYTVVEAENGRDAAFKLESSKASLIITDINMPEMNGIEFITHVRSTGNYKFTPIIVLTTESEKEMQDKGKAAGATAWLIKPFTPERLKEIAKKVAG